MFLIVEAETRVVRKEYSSKKSEENILDFIFGQVSEMERVFPPISSPYFFL